MEERNNPSAPNKILILTDHGAICHHPTARDYLVVMGISERYERGEQIDPNLFGRLRSEHAEPFFKSLEFPEAVDTAELSALIRALEDEDPSVRRSAASSIAMFGPSASAAIPALLEAAGDKAQGVRQAAALALGKIGLKAVPALQLALKDQNFKVRTSAARALGWMGPEAAEAIPDLIEALKDEYGLVRSAAVSALGWVGPVTADVVPVLIDALNDPYLDDSAVTALGHIGPAAHKAVPALIDKLVEWEKDRDEFWAAEALREICPDTGDAIYDLAEALADEDPQIRGAAASSLAKLCSTN
jgi:HEAT repeat protein